MKQPLGINDEEFIRGNIPMTKQEVRMLVIAKAQISPGDVIVDIGAGTGSLSVEAALQSQTGRVFAVERAPEGIELIKANAAKFGVQIIQPILGIAPEALQDLAAVDVVLIGGSGGQLPAILAAATPILRAGGRLILTAVTVETLSLALTIMQAKTNFQVEAFGVQVTRIRKVRDSNMLQALNPVYIVTCKKEEE